LDLFYYLYKLGTHKVQRPFAFNKTLLLSLWVLIPIVALSLPVFAGVRNYSHLLPVFPAIAIIISVSVLRIPWKFARYTLALLVVVSSIPFWNINVRLPFYNNLPPDKKVPLGVAVSFYPRAHRLLRVEWHYVSVSELQRAYLLPNHENWQHKDILRFIDEDCNPGKDTPKVLLLGDDYIVRYYQFEYYNLQMKRMVFIFEPWHAPGLLCGNVSALKDSILNSTFDYIVMKSVHLDRDNKEVEIVKAVIDFIKNDEREFKMRYKCVQQFALPDSSFMFVYKRIDA
jgi:hypothetical protein